MDRRPEGPDAGTRNLLPCLGRSAEQGLWLYSRGQIKIFCDEKSEFDARQQQIPIFASGSELPFFPPLVEACSLSTCG